MKTSTAFLLAGTIFLLSHTELRAHPLYRGHRATQQRRVDRMSHWILDHAGQTVASSAGGVPFDGEGSMVTCQLATMGFAQIVNAHPELTEHDRPA